MAAPRRFRSTADAKSARLFSIEFWNNAESMRGATISFDNADESASRRRIAGHVPAGENQNGGMAAQGAGEDFGTLDAEAHTAIFNGRERSLGNAGQLGELVLAEAVAAQDLLLVPAPLQRADLKTAGCTAGVAA